MVHISKIALDKTVEKQLFKQFSSLFANCKELQVATLLDEVLTETEKIMLMKRVAVVIMLTEGFSSYKISKTLNMSESTIKNLKLRYKDKEFSGLLKSTSQKSFDREKFWQTLDVLLRLGMPPMGRGRWSYLDEQ